MTIGLIHPSLHGSTSGGNPIEYLNEGTASAPTDEIVGPDTFGPPTPVIDVGSSGPLEGSYAPVTADASPSMALTPDGLLVYCQSRLDSIGGQVDGIFDQQQQRNAETSAIQTVLQQFQQYTGGVSNDPTTCAKLEETLFTEIQSIRQSDPACPELGKLKQIYNDVLATGTGPTTTSDGVQLDYIDKDLYPPSLSNNADSTILDTEMKQFITNLQGCASDLNSDAELQMIQLQSLMSQRQTAIELTTNLVQSLGDQADKIAQNVGR